MLISQLEVCENKNVTFFSFLLSFSFIHKPYWELGGSLTLKFIMLKS